MRTALAAIFSAAAYLAFAFAAGCAWARLKRAALALAAVTVILAAAAYLSTGGGR